MYAGIDSCSPFYILILIWKESLCSCSRKPGRIQPIGGKADLMPLFRKFFRWSIFNHDLAITKFGAVQEINSFPGLFLS